MNISFHHKTTQKNSFTGLNMIDNEWKWIFHSGLFLFIYLIFLVYYVECINTIAQIRLHERIRTYNRIWKAVAENKMLLSY